MGETVERGQEREEESGETQETPRRHQETPRRRRHHSSAHTPQTLFKKALVKNISPLPAAKSASARQMANKTTRVPLLGPGRRGTQMELLKCVFIL